MLWIMDQASSRPHGFKGDSFMAINLVRITMDLQHYVLSKTMVTRPHFSTY